MKSSETKFWVKKAQRHDKDAFTELMQFYMKDMYRTAIAILMNEEDAADALQDTILTCWEKLYALKKPETLSEIGSFSTDSMQHINMYSFRLLHKYLHISTFQMHII